MLPPSNALSSGEATPRDHREWGPVRILERRERPALDLTLTDGGADGELIEAADDHARAPDRVAGQFEGVEAVKERGAVTNAA